MKVLFDHFLPFSFAHGGVQVQITQTREALQNLGVEADYLRWYDADQTGDVLHFFGRIPTPLLKLAHQKGMKVVISDLLGGLGARSAGKLRLQRLMTRALQKALPPRRLQAFGWESYRLADACIALTPWEAHLMSYIFGAAPSRVHVVPNGVEEVFLNSPRMERGPWLVCVGTIAPVKRMVELAEAALLAKTPLWVIGKAYSDSDSHAQRFFALARENPKIIRYEGPVEERGKIAQIYRQARGFVLLSQWESLSLSALEAAACECPLLLSDLPWARTTFNENASYCPNSSSARTAPFLRRFYDAAPNLKPPPSPQSWAAVGQQIKAVYDQVLRSSARPESQ
jgi:glycosyltransferase involved in cell wall biosynthesis